MCLNSKRSQTREDPVNEVTEEDYSSAEPTVRNTLIQSQRAIPVDIQKHLLHQDQ